MGSASGKDRMLYGDGSLHFDKATGLWIARLDLGYGADGKRKRWKGKSKTKSGALDKLRSARLELSSTGTVQSRGITVAAWMETWLRDIVKPRVRPNVHRDYAQTVNKHVVPRLGKVPVSRLTVEQVRSLHMHVQQATSLGNANKVIRVLKASLSDAEREGKVARNVAKLMRMPASPRTRPPLSDDDAMTFIRQGVDHPMYSRFLAGLLLGCRQGEVLGMTWDRVDLDAGIVTLEWQLQQLPYRHGCGTGEPPSCGRKAPGHCTHKALDVPEGYEYRHLFGSKCLVRPKTTAGVRVIPMPGILVDALRRRRRESIATPNPHGLVWTDERGNPIDDRRDLDAWKQLQRELGLPGVDLHSMRHTTATVLLKLGVPDTVRMQIMGHSTAAVTRMYEHVDTTMARRALDAVAEHLTSVPTKSRGA